MQVPTEARSKGSPGVTDAYEPPNVAAGRWLVEEQQVLLTEPGPSP